MTIEQDDNYRLIDRSLYQRQYGLWQHVASFNLSVTLEQAIYIYEDDQAESADEQGVR